MSRTAFKPNAKFRLVLGLLLDVHGAFAEVIVGKVCGSLTAIRSIFWTRPSGNTIYGLKESTRQTRGSRSINALGNHWPSYAPVSRAKLNLGRRTPPIAKVLCGGVDANSEQVRRGFAWAFVRYLSLGSPLYELEAYARATAARPVG